MTELLRQAWRLRYDQRIEEVLVLLAQIKRELALPVTEPTLAELDRCARKHDAETVIQTLLLQASVHRAQALPEKSKLYRQAAENLSQLHPGSGEFFLCLERGLDLLFRGSRPEALECFMRAAQIAPDAEFEIPARVNTLMVLEHMALPSDKTRTDLITLLEKTPSPNAKIALNHVAIFDSRKLFHAGQINSLMQKAQNHTGTQVRYFREWISQLPFHTGFDPSGQSTQAWIAAGTNATFQASYRVRTLQGCWVPDDQEPMLISEWCDRLYLWVWRWITQPEAFPIERIKKILRPNLLDSVETQGTVEDRQLVRNALLWLSLFDSRSNLGADSRFAANVATPSPLLSLERAFVQWLTAKRDRQDELCKDLSLQLETHPLWNNEEILFKALARSIETESTGHLALGGLASLKASLLATVQSVSVKDAQITINLRTSEVHIKRGRGHQTQVSQALCSAFDILKNQGTVEIAEFARTAFDIRRYDAAIHLGKINNLLARMRNIAGDDLGIKMKEGKIFAAGSWSKFHWIKASANTRILLQQGGIELDGESADEAPSTSRAEVDPRAIFEKSRNASLSRSELETLLGKPRSTVNRLVAGWVKSGILTKSGDARTTRYSLKRSEKEKSK